jgi:hypothetical protein
MQRLFGTCSGSKRIRKTVGGQSVEIKLEKPTA